MESKDPVLTMRWAESDTTRVLKDSAWVFGVVFAASVFGIATRPVGFLAAFWPANALLLGLLVRVPRMATAAGWLSAFAGYVMADVMWGDELHVAAALTLCNLAFVGVGFSIYRRIRPEHSRMEDPRSSLYMFAICMLAAASAALVAWAVVSRVLPSLWNKGDLLGLAYWFSAELVNGILILPAVLAFPSVWRTPQDRRRTVSRRWLRVSLWRMGPALALVVTVAAAAVVGGPGAIAFPVPALLLCALSYRIYTTILLTLIVSVWHIIAASIGVLQLPVAANFLDDTVSLRLGIALMALGPLSVASVSALKNDLLSRLQDAVNNDFLTGALSRSAFFRRGLRLLDGSGKNGLVVAMMLDVDLFKRINDDNGHAGGDLVLQSFVATVTDGLRKDDLLGRLGGEEFAVLMSSSSLEDAVATAERVRAAVQAQGVKIASGAMLQVTVSVGVASTQAEPNVSLDELLQRADKALYQAKHQGRNRVVVV